MLWGFPWWLSGKESACQCRKCGFHPWPGESPHVPGFAPQPLSLCVRAWSLCTQEPMVHNKRSHQIQSLVVPSYWGRHPDIIGRRLRGEDPPHPKKYKYRLGGYKPMLPLWRAIWPHFIKLVVLFSVVGCQIGGPPWTTGSRYATPTLVLNSRPSRVTCFGQQVISKSETSRDLISTCTCGLKPWNCHAVRKPKLPIRRDHVEETWGTLLTARPKAPHIWPQLNFPRCSRGPDWDLRHCRKETAHRCTLLELLLFFWSCWMACGTLIPQLGIKPMPLALEVWSPFFFFNSFIYFWLH